MANLYDIALEAINTLFSDKSSSKEDTIINLNTLKMEIDDMISLLKSDS